MKNVANGVVIRMENKMIFTPFVDELIQMMRLATI